MCEVLAESLVLSYQLGIGALVTILSLDARLTTTQQLVLARATGKTFLASWRSLSSLD